MPGKIFVVRSERNRLMEYKHGPVAALGVVVPLVLTLMLRFVVVFVLACASSSDRSVGRGDIGAADSWGGSAVWGRIL